jgi:hypothetical protein
MRYLVRGDLASAISGSSIFAPRLDRPDGEGTLPIRAGRSKPKMIAPRSYCDAKYR